MKRIFTALAFWIFTATAAFAQFGEMEIADLRARAAISGSEIVRVDQDAGLTKNASKIFLSIGRDGSEEKFFEKWINDWNKKDGGKYGRLERVNDMSDADIVLAQFQKDGEKYVEEASVNVGNIKPNGQIDSNVTARNGIGYRSLKLPVYSYLLKRENDRWTVLYGGVETAIPGEQIINPEIALWRAVKEKMKDR